MTLEQIPGYFFRLLDKVRGQRSSWCRELIPVSGETAAPNGHGGEITLIIGGDLDSSIWEEKQVREALVHQLDIGSRPSEAAKEVAKKSGWKRRDVYQIIQEIK